jgi:hypothetical protein
MLNWTRMVSPYTINHCFLLLRLLNGLMLSKNGVLDQLTVLIMGAECHHLLLNGGVNFLLL